MRKMKALLTVGLPGYVATGFTPYAIDRVFNTVGINHQHISNWSDYFSNPVYMLADAALIAGTAYALSIAWDVVSEQIK